MSKVLVSRQLGNPTHASLSPSFSKAEPNMGASSSQPGREETAALQELLSSSDALPHRQLYLGKNVSCLDRYNICEATSGRPVYLVRSDLSAAREQKGKRKTTSIYLASEGNDEDGLGEVVGISAIESSSDRWQIEVTLDGTNVSCNVQSLSGRGRTTMSMTFGNEASSGTGEAQTLWSLQGDKVSLIGELPIASSYAPFQSRQSAVITASDGRLIAHIERHSRNKGQHFHNPHAYLLTTASQADDIFVVIFCICLDKVENKSREKGYAREVRRARSKGVKGMSGYHDADGLGSACF